MERKNEEKATQVRELAQRAYFTNLGLAENERIVWGAESKLSASDLPQDAASAFSTINLHVYDGLKNQYKFGEFIPPSKSEYETTAEYQKRVTRLRARYETEMAEAKQKTASEKKTLLEKRLLLDLGTPVVVTPPSYNVDKKSIDYIIGAQSTHYEINATYPAPVSTAPGIKTKLYTSTPYVVFAFKDNMLVLHDVFLQNGAEVIPLKIVSSTNIPIQFTDAAALAWEQKLEQDKKAAAEARHREEEARARREEAHARAEAARPKSNNDGFDLVSRYANKLAAQLEQSGNPSCQYIASSIRTFGNSSAPDYVRQRQVDNFLGHAPASCIH